MWNLFLKLYSLKVAFFVIDFLSNENKTGFKNLKSILRFVNEKLQSKNRTSGKCASIPNSGELNKKFPENVYFPQYLGNLYRPSGLLVSFNLWHKQLTILRATLVLFLFTVVWEMGISCCAMLILCLNHIGELQLFFSLSSFSTFLFMCLSLWQSFSWVPL